LREAESILVRDELPIVPLYFETGLLFYRPDEIEGMHDNLIDEHPVRALRQEETVRCDERQPETNEVKAPSSTHPAKCTT
jgi:hypothetical protein